MSLGVFTERLVSIVDRLNQVAKALVVSGLLVMVVLISIQIGVRFILPKFGISVSVPWTEELARYAMVWVVFIGGAIAARHGLLIAVLALVNALPETLARVCRVLTLIALIIFFIAMAWTGWNWSVFGAGETSPAMGVSKFWLYLSMPVGFGIAAINVIALSLEEFSKQLDVQYRTTIMREPKC